MQILLITSTIAPRGKLFALSRSDPLSRLADYRLVLQIYLSQLAAGAFDRLVYVDNSGHALDESQAMTQASPKSDCVEFVSYAAAPASEDLSRLFLESGLLQEAFQRSRTLGEAGPDDVA